MAENHPNKAQETPDSDALDHDLAAGDQSPGFDESGSMEEPSGASLEDTAEPSPLQGQEKSRAENNGAGMAKPQGFDDLNANLQGFEREMNQLLKWKEGLKLTSIEHQLSGAYYDMWIKEANLFFRRLVILRRRMQTLKTQKRA